MNRRSFISSSLAALVSVPLISRLIKRPESKSVITRSDLAIRDELDHGDFTVRPGCNVLFEIPPEAGRFLSMGMVNGKLVMAMENGVWISDAPYKSCRKLVV